MAEQRLDTEPPRRPSRRLRVATRRLSPLLAVGLAALGLAAPDARASRAEGVDGAWPSAVAAALGAVRHQATEPPAYLGARNLLHNPGFERSFRPAGANELIVGEGWEPWYDARYTRPEYKDEPHVRYRHDGGVEAFSLRVFHGVQLQKFFTSSSPHDAGFYQTTRVTEGARVRFSIWVQTWSSDCDDPCVSPTGPCRAGSSNSHGTYRASAGIHAGGATPSAQGEPAPDGTVWSEPVVFEAYDRWLRLQVETVAQGDHVTVFVRGNPEWGVKHNDSYWDDARLEIIDAPPKPFAAWVPLALWRRGDSAAVARRGLAALAEPVPPFAEVHIEYPVRAFPGQANFEQPTCDDLEFENVLLRNVGHVDVQLEGWTLSDAQGNQFTFPRLSLTHGDQVRVWSKPGENAADGRFADLYWDRQAPVWDGPGDALPWDEAILRDDAGAEVARRGYP